MSASYADFLSRKSPCVPRAGIDVPLSQIGSHLFPFQRDITGWALRRGRAAIFAGTGLGKTAMQIEWALAEPAKCGAWINADGFGGWTCCVEQGHYGHRARKATWLYARRAGVHVPWNEIPKRLRAATPLPFRDLLLDIARSVTQ